MTLHTLLQYEYFLLPLRFRTIQTIISFVCCSPGFQLTDLCVIDLPLFTKVLLGGPLQ